MPMIPYKCTECEKEFEVFYKSQSERSLEEANEPCPQCGSTKKEQQVSTETSFVLKGRGWYRDGY